MKANFFRIVEDRIQDESGRGKIVSLLVHAFTTRLIRKSRVVVTVVVVWRMSNSRRVFALDVASI